MLYVNTLENTLKNVLTINNFARIYFRKGSVKSFMVNVSFYPLKTKGNF